MEERNAVIAVYMGLIVKDFGAAFIRYTIPEFETEPYYEWNLVRDLDYHTSYNSLMPVVKKAADELHHIYLYGEYPRKDEQKIRDLMSQIDGLCSHCYHGIDGLYDKIIEAIVFINGLKK